MRCKLCSIGVLMALLSTFCLADTPREAVDRALDRFHQAAADADFEAYTGLMTEAVVFLGTDATERWQGQAFRDFAKPYFVSGRGWTYHPRDRHITLDEEGDTAWFDEALDHARLGVCRGSGVLAYREGRWLVAQYNLSMPIPNSMIDAVAVAISEEFPADEEALTPPAADSSEAVAPAANNCRRKRHKTNRKAGC